MKIKRRKTRTVKIGGVKIGSKHPIAIQSMTNTDTKDVPATVRQIRKKLEKAGCEIVRVAVKDIRSAKAIKRIRKKISIPLVTDIHFDHRLAIAAIDAGADKIRINPGNMRPEGLVDVAELCAKKKVPVRIGVNSGSVPKGKSMVRLALDTVKKFEKAGVKGIVISIKASSIKETVEASRAVARKCDYPLHIGVTAAGLPEDGIIASSAGIGALLLDGIGDTIRVSLTGDPILEVDTAKRLLSVCGVRQFGPRIIACPTCGRCQVDLERIVRRTEYGVRGTKKSITIAVMGCEVNGPGEAREADIGIAFGKRRGAIFKKGKIVSTVPASRAIKELLKQI